MALDQRQSRFRALPTVAFGLAAPVFFVLGLWQLDRADEKRELAAVREQQTQLPPLDLADPLAPDRDLGFRQVRTQGQFEPDQQIFLENRRYRGRLGFQVVTPLRVAGTDLRVLVNRGWVAAGSDGGLPEVFTPAERVEVKGMVHLPAAPALALDGGSAAGWGQRWPYLTIDLYQGVVPFPILPLVILEDPADPHGFARAWPQEPPKIGMHISYAIQWLAFSCIALALAWHMRPAQVVESVG